MAKAIIVTGTSKGIGKELCERYLQEGYLVAGCARSQSKIAHENYRHFSLDVSDEIAVVAMIREIKREFGGIDALINNAGIASMNHFLTTPFDSVKKVFETNFFGTFLFSREVGKVMMKQKSGRIVNYTTVASALRLEGEAIYAASKSAIENLTQTLSKELAPFNVTVNALGPTPIKTDLIKAVPQDKINALLERQAIKRFGNFGDIKNAIDFFIDEKSDFITGQILYLGGVHN